MRRKLNLNTKKIFKALSYRDINDTLYIPTRVKQAAQELDGKTLPLGEAVKMIQNVTYKKIIINQKLRFIVIKVGSYGLRVVRFRSKKKIIKKATPA